MLRGTCAHVSSHVSTCAHVSSRNSRKVSSLQGLMCPHEPPLIRTKHSSPFAQTAHAQPGQTGCQIDDAITVHSCGVYTSIRIFTSIQIQTSKLNMSTQLSMNQNPKTLNPKPYSSSLKATHVDTAEHDTIYYPILTYPHHLLPDPHLHSAPYRGA